MQPGDTVVQRGIFRGRIRWAVPHRLVELRADRVVLFLPEGTRLKGPHNYGQLTYAEQLNAGWEVVDRTWERHHVLKVIPFGGAHEIDLFWTPEWEFRCWYVNLQEPVRRTPLGWDTLDQQLDIVVRPDRSWEWKDEEEFDDLVAAGILTGTQHARVRAEAERVLADLEAWAPPFSEGWERWRPPPEWTLPELPEGWDVV